ncbi:hypothetical protein B6I21_00135 [candidate division KSB1 bacterium 4572_119]|nr:MAG: hypothetical protein B6I21_00135 [candidate division KSB1 bacterium 4572_119]
MSLGFIIGGIIIAGFILILVEIFLVPGLNIFGIFGFGLIVLGIILAYTKLDARIANFILIAAIIISAILIRFVVKSKTWREMVLSTDQKKTEGFHASADNLPALMGKHGSTYTKLRPAGIALIDNEKVDVVAEGAFIEKDRPIEVILVEGNRVVVRETANK